MYRQTNRRCLQILLPLLCLSPHTFRPWSYRRPIFGIPGRFPCRWDFSPFLYLPLFVPFLFFWRLIQFCIYSSFPSSRSHPSPIQARNRFLLFHLYINYPSPGSFFLPLQNHLYCLKTCLVSWRMNLPLTPTNLFLPLVSPLFLMRYLFF